MISELTDRQHTRRRGKLISAIKNNSRSIINTLQDLCRSRIEVTMNCRRTKVDPGERSCKYKHIGRPAAAAATTRCMAHMSSLGTMCLISALSMAVCIRIYVYVSHYIDQYKCCLCASSNPLQPCIHGARCSCYSYSVACVYNPTAADACMELPPLPLAGRLGAPPHKAGIIIIIALSLLPVSIRGRRCCCSCRPRDLLACCRRRLLLRSGLLLRFATDAILI